jgi:hypothetical protein
VGWRLRESCCGLAALLQVGLCHVSGKGGEYEVNDELNEVKSGLAAARELLRPGGLIAGWSVQFAGKRRRVWGLSCALVLFVSVDASPHH